jgi:putative transposase
MRRFGKPLGELALLADESEPSPQPGFEFAEDGKRLFLADGDKVPHDHWKTSKFPGGVAKRPHRRALPVRRANQRRALPMSSSSWFRPSSRMTTSSSSTTSDRTKERRSAPRSKRQAGILPPKYSPDLNPIEQVFAKLKTLVRKAAPRSLDAVSDSIANALRAVSLKECSNYLRNAENAYT